MRAKRAARIVFGCSGLWLGCALAAAVAEPVSVPSDPAAWPPDVLRLTRPSQACPGGTLDHLRERAGVSAPYSVRDTDVARRFSLASLHGVADSDRLYEFFFRADLPSGSFWGFNGYVVVRASCVIHAAIIGTDN